MNSLTNLSPLDGRYHEQVKELGPYFSEMALMKYRLMIEVEYLIALSKEKNITEIKQLNNLQIKKLRNLYFQFTLKNAEKIKEIESVTKHDVKAIEYFLREKLKKSGLDKYIPFVHFALTSEDINNLAYSLMWKDALNKEYLTIINAINKRLISFAKKYKNQPLLSLTHGQPATPTTVGKEFAVFASRLSRQIKQLKEHHLQGKFGGATGTWSAQAIAYPKINWLDFSKKFISGLGLEPNLITTQIESHDSLAESYHILERINTILIDFCRDAWFYISRGVFMQQKKAGEVGSSTMPHKINPIHFENAEGNLGLANAYFTHLAQKLPISRLQRDLTDSTVLRNQGVAIAHSLLACKNILAGLSRIAINKQRLHEELDSNPEILAEAIQTILRKLGRADAYETLKSLTRGKKIKLPAIKKFIKNLDIPNNEKQKLLKLTPQSYVGLASKLSNLI